MPKNFRVYSQFVIESNGEDLLEVKTRKMQHLATLNRKGNSYTVDEIVELLHNTYERGIQRGIDDKAREIKSILCLL